MSAKRPETPEEYAAHQRRLRERFVLDACDYDGGLRREFRTLRNAALILDAWASQVDSPDGIPLFEVAADHLELYIQAKVAAVMKAKGL